MRFSNELTTVNSRFIRQWPRLSVDHFYAERYRFAATMLMAVAVACVDHWESLDRSRAEASDTLHRAEKVQEAWSDVSMHMQKQEALVLVYDLEVIA